MPASPSLQSDGRGRWKRRRRAAGDPPTGRKQKCEENEEEDDENEENEDELDAQNEEPVAADHQNPNPNEGAPAANAAPAQGEVLADGGVRISEFPLAFKRAVNRPHPSVTGMVAAERAGLIGDRREQSGSALNLENVSFGQMQAVSAVPRAEVAAASATTVGASGSGTSADLERNGDGSGGPCVIQPPQIMEGKGAMKQFWGRAHVVPMHSDWFDPATVNRLERQVVPHFFSGKSPEHVPEKYMDCRNHILAKYMEKPKKRLTASDCQGLVDGISNEDLSRIVRFLDHWGVINYSAPVPPRDTWNEHSYLREDQNSEVHVPSAALKSIDSLIKFDKPKCRLKAADVYSSTSCRGDDVSDLDSTLREHLSENHCNYCSQPLPMVHYQSQKEVDVVLCCNCFHEGRFVTGHSSVDFMRVDTSKDYVDVDGDSWSDEETLLLLEALEIYHENWNDIAEHVGTKSRSQCVTHFLRLPIEDGLLDNVEVPSMPKSTNLSNGDDHGRMLPNSNGDIQGSHHQDAGLESSLPFANAGNPVMSLVSFLAAYVGPRVAAACAHASLAVLSQEVEKSAHGNRINLESKDGREGSNSIQQTDGNSVVHGSEGFNVPEETVKAAAKAGLSAAATKTKLFADHEEREIQRLSANIINHQLKRLELKLKQFAEVETLLMKECEIVERARQRISGERARIVTARLGPAGASSQVNVPGAGPSMVNNNFSNNRQSMMTASTSQPSASGYANNQAGQSQMPYMPRQPMFPLGPRHPLGNMQPSSSASPSAMYNASGNSQPGHSHPMLRPLSNSSSGLG